MAFDAGGVCDASVFFHAYDYHGVTAGTVQFYASFSLCQVALVAEGHVFVGGFEHDSLFVAFETVFILYFCSWFVFFFFSRLIAVKLQ
jgi:hypothetical protein